MRYLSQRMAWCSLALAAGLLALAVHPAAAQLQWSAADGSSSLKLGVLGQLQGQDIDTPDGKQSAKDLYFRRLRLIGLFKYGDKLSVFFDTDDPNLGKGNADGTKNVNTSMYIQDFVVTYAFAHEFQLDGGEILLAQSYNHNSSSAQLMPLDFGPFTFTETGAIQGNTGRDYGGQARGYLANDHLEYRLGAFQGNRGKNEVNAFRYAGRLSLWVFGAQTGLNYRGTSLGKVQSMEIGGSFDRQKQYSAYTGDFFWDQPLGNGDGITLQFDYTKWDGGTFLLDIPKQNTLLAEAGYYLSAIKTQPFFQYSKENFDHHSRPDQKRTTFGLGFFPLGHNSDAKFAYTRLQGTGQVSRSQYQLQYQIWIW
ncbi:MAG TPA: hypothetical protein VHG32_11660 [Thermoanaerobaculia bacterium]|jgi:hypothetical protein|nr:hypothetical protein [Thermoanaerobaculia bacterium]